MFVAVCLVRNVVSLATIRQDYIREEKRSSFPALVRLLSPLLYFYAAAGVFDNSGRVVDTVVILEIVYRVVA